LILSNNTKLLISNFQHKFEALKSSKNLSKSTNKRRVPLNKNGFGLTGLSISTETSRLSNLPRKSFHSNINSNQSGNFFINFINEIKSGGRKKILTYIGVAFGSAILVIGIGFYSVLSYTSFYEVNISYEFKNLLEERQVQASTNSPEYKINELTETDSLSIAQNATGEKVVGEKAQGRITIFNATPEIKVLPKGTQITCVSSACNGLVYVSVNDLNLGPGNSSNNYEIIASDIGDNYNLAINAGRFRIANFNSTTEIIASNIEQITGGTPKKFVKIVSENDVKAIEEKANNDLKNLLLAKFQSNQTYRNKYFLSDTSIRVEITNKQIDEVGKEAEIVNGSFEAKGVIDAFPRENIQSIIDDIKANIAPDGYFLDERSFVAKTNILPSTPGNINVNIKATGIARTRLNVDEIKNDIAGKSLPDADRYLSQIPNTKSFSTTYSPQTMPEFLRRVPSNASQIKINIIAEAPQ
jgi:hypothetical protein